MRIHFRHLESIAGNIDRTFLAVVNFLSVNIGDEFSPFVGMVLASHIIVIIVSLIVVCSWKIDALRRGSEHVCLGTVELVPVGYHGLFGCIKFIGGPK